MTDLPSLPELFDLERLEPDLFQSRVFYDDRWGMYGGQAAALSLLAAGLTVEQERLPHSLHGYFVSRGNPAKPMQFRVNRDRDGRAFSARRVTAEQDGEVIFSMSASFAVPASTRKAFPDQEAEPVPDMPPVESLRPRTISRYPSLEFRPVDGQEDRRVPDRFWLKCTDELPEDPLVHAAVLAYVSDVSTALLPFEVDGVRVGPSLDHAVWFHRPANMADWHWQELIPRTVAGGRGWYTVAIYAPDGTRVATVAQEQLFAARRVR